MSALENMHMEELLDLLETISERQELAEANLALDRDAMLEAIMMNLC